MRLQFFRGFISVVFVSLALFSGSHPPASDGPIERWILGVIVKALGCEDTSANTKESSNQNTSSGQSSSTPDLNTPEGQLYFDKETRKADEENSAGKINTAIKRLEKLEKEVANQSTSKNYRENQVQVHGQLGSCWSNKADKLPWYYTKTMRAEVSNKAGSYYEDAAKYSDEDWEQGGLYHSAAHEYAQYNKPKGCEMFRSAIAAFNQSKNLSQSAKECQEDMESNGCK